MSATPHRPTSHSPEDAAVKTREEAPRAGVIGTVVAALALLLAGLPAVLILTTVVMLNALSGGPVYETPLEIVTSIEVVVISGLALRMGTKLFNRSPIAAGVVFGASLLTCLLALIVTTGGLSAGDGGPPPPTVVNRSSDAVDVLAGTGDVRPWVTLEPGESAQLDPPPLSTDGCYHGLWIEARTSEGRVLGTLFNPCNKEIWEITDSGANRS